MTIMKFNNGVDGSEGMTHIESETGKQRDTHICLDLEEGLYGFYSEMRGGGSYTATRYGPGDV